MLNLVFTRVTGGFDAKGAVLQISINRLIGIAGVVLSGMSPLTANSQTVPVVGQTQDVFNLGRASVVQIRTILKGST